MEQVTDEQEIKSKDMMYFEFPMYQKWHAIMSDDLTMKEKVFERNLIGLSVNDIDRLYALTGCRRLEDYLLRTALNDTVFTGLVEQSMNGKNPKSIGFIS